MVPNRMWENEMARYLIENIKSGLILGSYDGASEDEALDAMARDAGYIDYSDCVRQLDDGSVDGGRAEICITKMA